MRTDFWNRQARRGQSKGPAQEKRQQGTDQPLPHDEPIGVGSVVEWIDHVRRVGVVMARRNNVVDVLAAGMVNSVTLDVSQVARRKLG